ncbi:MAG: exodeoxyribonuclease VII large subunit [Candidatus Omnitrophica bacterium]|nr:exodeoxyribonuclease VII large subunit [Candidatus Omnitrophota bacterium]
MPKDSLQPDLFSQKNNPQDHIYTVSEITQDIKLILENTFGEIWIEGEISNFRPSSAGHYYFSLKDEGSILQAVIFSRLAKEVRFKIEDGLKVICHGSVEVYGPRGQYQLIVDKIEPKGLGSLQLALEQLKQKLEKEGLFSPEHKRTIPQLPSRIGVVTSLQGAAIKDILQVLERRFKDVHIIINPVRVQGEGAKEDIAGAIKDMNDYNQQAPVCARIEVMIVGRGGGSIEDLWAFNEEMVARAIYNSRIPVISAVGHERDWTIADLVADVRAATPSVAAEIVIPKKEDLKIRLDSLFQDLKRALSDYALSLGDDLEDLAHRLILSLDHIFELSIANFNSAQKKLAILNPMAVIRRYQEKIGTSLNQVSLAANHFVKIRQAEFTRASGRLSSLSPLSILSRGYSITFQAEGEGIIKEASQVSPGDLLKTRLHRGEIISRVIDKQ